MDAVTVKKWCGISIAAVLTAVTIVWWVILNAFSPLGNQFASGRVPIELLLYGRLIGILAAILFLVLLLTMGKGRTVELLFPKALLEK